MTTKKLDQILDVCLWVLFVLLVVGSFVFSRTFKAPKFEVVETSVQIPYVYSSNDGERYDSFYGLAWMHEAFSRPKVVAYDSRNGQYATIKDEYVDEYKALMPESQYPFYTRWTFAFFILLAIASGFFSYFVGGWFRDLILYMKVKSSNDFKECAYFLYEERVGFTSDVKKLIGVNIGRYINEKSQQLYKKYNPEFANLLLQILRNVQISENTEVAYYLTYNNQTTDQAQYLRHLRSYWDSKIGQHPNAEGNVAYINELLTRTYLPVTLLVSDTDISKTVSNQLNKLFTNILGSEVLKFESYGSHYAKTIKRPNCVFIDIIVRNHTNTFTWSGPEVSPGTKIPGLEIEFQAFHFVGGEKKVLWDRYLLPKCTYTDKEGEFASSELYKSMVLETITTFENSENV